MRPLNAFLKEIIYKKKTNLKNDITVPKLAMVFFVPCFEIDKKIL